MYLSRIQLTPALKEQTQLGQLLRRDNYGMHQLLWDLFPDGQYLFREESSHKQLGSLQHWPLFYVLSACAPEGDSPLFQIDSKPFQPHLQTGDRLAFHLRANPTIARRQQGKKNSARHDVVMDAKFQHLLHNCLEHGVLTGVDIYDSVEGERRVLRNSLNRKQLQRQLFSLPAFSGTASRETFMQKQLAAVDRAATGWLEKKAESRGFKLETVQATGYLWHSLSDAKQKRHAGYSSMDYQGILQIADKDIFWEQLQKGFGPAKRFGCGLMLIRRV